MKVLQICSKPPLPPIDGGCKATNVITEGLLENSIDLKVITIATAKHPFIKEKFSADYINNTNVEYLLLDTSVKFFDAFLNLFTSQSYNVSRFYDVKFEQLIIKTLKEQEFDIVLFEGLYVLPYLSSIRKNSSAKIINRAQNIEFEIWEKNAEEATNIFKSWYFKLLAKRLKKFEISVLNKLDGIAAITKNDKERLISLGCKKPIEVIPFGITLDDYKTKPLKNTDSVFFIGSLDWIPNQEALKWILNDVWDGVIEKLPHAKFYIAGKNTPDWLLNIKKQNVVVLGEVPSAIDFINDNEIMLAPLFSGSGIRVKILEGMALSKPVIANAFAAEGIDYHANKDIIIANDTNDFIDAIVYYLQNKDASNLIGENAKKMIATNYDNKVIVNNLVAFFNQII